MNIQTVENRGQEMAKNRDVELPVSLPDTADLRGSVLKAVENPASNASGGGAKGKTAQTPLEAASLRQTLADCASISISKGRSVVVDFAHAGQGFALYNLLAASAFGNEPRCSNCGRSSFTPVDMQQPNGTFASGPERRCIECKTTFNAQEFAGLSEQPHD